MQQVYDFCTLQNCGAVSVQRRNIDIMYIQGCSGKKMHHVTVVFTLKSFRSAPWEPHHQPHNELFPVSLSSSSVEDVFQIVCFLCPSEVWVNSWGRTGMWKPPLLVCSTESAPPFNLLSWGVRSEAAQKGEFIPNFVSNCSFCLFW